MSPAQGKAGRCVDFGFAGVDFALGPRGKVAGESRKKTPGIAQAFFKESAKRLFPNVSLRCLGFS